MKPSITDWLMVIITFAYVVATIFICRANVKSAQATREQIAEAKRQFEESNRAFVTVSFEIIRSGIVALHIQNLGKRIANDVHIYVSGRFLDNIADKSGREHLKKLCDSTFQLGIGQSWYICIGSHLQLAQMSQEILEIDVSYNDMVSKYSEKISIDLKQYFWALMYESPMEDTYQEARKISSHIGSMDKSLQMIIQKNTEQQTGGKT